MSKPSVYKMGDAWVWQCNCRPEESLMGYAFPHQWKDPWSVVLAMATEHAAVKHGSDEVLAEGVWGEE